MLGPLSFFIFVLVASIILLNIFLTLIISAFETVKHDVLKQSNEYEIVDFMIRKMKAMFGLADLNDPKALLADADEGINSIEEQLNVFPEKVDRLLHYINDVYFNGQLEVDVDTKNAMKRMAMTSNARANRVSPSPVTSARSHRRRSRRESNLRLSQPQQQPRITILDWMEVQEEQPRAK